MRCSVAVWVMIAAVGRSAAHAEPLAIQKVTTWEQLLKQPVIELEDGVKVRLGVESLECPRWSGVTLYAYTDGFDDRKPRDVNRDTLGPMWASLRFGATNFDCKDTYRVIPRWESEMGDKQPRLFCRVLMADKIGEYSVTVRKRNGEDAAKAVVRGADAAYHPWSPLRITEHEVHEVESKEGKYRRRSPSQATYDGKGIALPNMGSIVGFTANGWEPRLHQRGLASGKDSEVATFPFGKGDLPKLLPEKITSDLQVKYLRESATLHMSVTSKWHLARPDSPVLCRWWVNGNPFQPHQDKSLRFVNEGMSKYPGELNDRRIDLKLASTDLHADSGDMIELQLLHCPCGWSAAKNPTDGDGASGEGFPLLSSKARFRFP